MTRYGYIGLGMMGSAMAECLLGTGAVVTVTDIDDAACATAVGRGAISVPTPAAVVAASDVISICVPAAEHIDAVLSGPGGIVEGGCSGRSILVHSTVHPQTMTDARATAAAAGAALFDACIGGGPEAARVGESAMFVGGHDEMPTEVTELLDVYASEIIAPGPVGSGAALKIAVNVMTYAQFAAAATSYDLVRGAGGDPEALFDALRHLGQLGTLTEQYSALLGIPAEHLTGPFGEMLATQVGIAQKDLSLALQLGETRPGTDAIIRAIHDAVPAIYSMDVTRADG